MLNLSEIDKKISTAKNKKAIVLQKADVTGSKRNEFLRKAKKIEKLIQYLEIIKKHAADYEAGSGILD